MSKPPYRGGPPWGSQDPPPFYNPPPTPRTDPPRTPPYVGNTGVFTDTSSGTSRVLPVNALTGDGVVIFVGCQASLGTVTATDPSGSVWLTYPGTFSTNPIYVLWCPYLLSNGPSVTVKSTNSNVALIGWLQIVGGNPQFFIDGINVINLSAASVSPFVRTTTQADLIVAGATVPNAANPYTFPGGYSSQKIQDIPNAFELDIAWTTSTVANGTSGTVCTGTGGTTTRSGAAVAIRTLPYFPNQPAPPVALPILPPGVKGRPPTPNTLVPSAPAAMPPAAVLLVPPQDYREGSLSSTFPILPTPASQNQLIRQLQSAPQEYREERWSFVYAPATAPASSNPNIQRTLTLPQEYREEGWSKVHTPFQSQQQLLHSLGTLPQEYREDYFSRIFSPFQSQQQLTRPILQTLPQDYREDFWSRTYAPLSIPGLGTLRSLQSYPQEILDQRWSLVITPQQLPSVVAQSPPPFVALTLPEQWPITDINYSAIYAPAPAPAPFVPPVIPPPAAGGGPGKLPGKRRRKSDVGPTMREDQVFGEQYAISPQAGPGRVRDERGRFIRGVKVKMELAPREGDNPPVWSIYLDTTFTDLDE